MHRASPKLRWRDRLRLSPLGAPVAQRLRTTTASGYASNVAVSTVHQEVVRSGREARFREPTETSNPIGPAGSLNLSVNGTGPAYEIEFIGTAFLVGKGMVLTNRHVVQPWIDDTTASMILKSGISATVKAALHIFSQGQSAVCAEGD